MIVREIEKRNHAGSRSWQRKAGHPPRLGRHLCTRHAGPLLPHRKGRLRSTSPSLRHVSRARTNDEKSNQASLITQCFREARCWSWSHRVESVLPASIDEPCRSNSQDYCLNAKSAFADSAFHSLLRGGATTRGQLRSRCRSRCGWREKPARTGRTRRGLLGRPPKGKIAL